ncbi:hypothetical protein MAHJHV61_13550 [Mycobacterium avium subsp. hominissuis]
MAVAGACSTSGTTPASMPGCVFDLGSTRRLTGKSSTTSSEPSAHHPRTNNAQAAVSTDDRRTPNALDNSLTLPITDSSNCTGGEGEYGSRPSSAGRGGWPAVPSPGRCASQ